jgi:LysM repeat protein
VSPPAALAVEKQRRLCLDAGHIDCSTFRAATAARDGDPTRATRWGFARTSPVVFDTRRFALPLDLDGRGRPVAQAALVGLMAVAFGAVAISRLADDGGAVLDASSSPPSNAIASPAASPRATPGTATPGPTIATVSPTPAPASPPATVAPTLGPTAAPTAVAVGQAYTIQSGDTLYAIAARFETTVQAIQAANGMGTSTVIRVGQVLLIPS